MVDFDRLFRHRLKQLVVLFGCGVGEIAVIFQVLCFHVLGLQIDARFFAVMYGRLASSGCTGFPVGTGRRSAAVRKVWVTH